LNFRLKNAITDLEASSSQKDLNSKTTDQSVLFQTFTAVLVLILTEMHVYFESLSAFMADNDVMKKISE
jgi:succinate dehydrogenase hydrophobic anchor subunit